MVGQRPHIVLGENDEVSKFTKVLVSERFIRVLKVYYYRMVMTSHYMLLKIACTSLWQWSSRVWASGILLIWFGCFVIHLIDGESKKVKIINKRQYFMQRYLFHPYVCSHMNTHTHAHACVHAHIQWKTNVINSIQIIAVSWNQRIHGPLRVPAADVEAYYKAYVLLAELFDSSERTLQIRLLPGQALSLNNRRILHGRNSFKGISRHLQVNYLNIAIHWTILQCYRISWY